MPAYDQNSVLTSVEIKQLLRLQEPMCNHNITQVFPYDPSELAIHFILCPEVGLISNCG